MRTALSVLVLTLSLSAAASCAQKPFIDWANLHNPILSYPNWSIKDTAMTYRDGVFYVFFSAFYDDHGRVRSHVVEVTTRDFKTFSDPVFDFDGEDDGWIGMCSPDVQKLGNFYELSFNSWGDDPQKPDQLFYMTSKDLIHWSARKPLGENLTAGRGVIDASVTRAGEGFYLMWKDGRTPMKMGPRLAEAKSLAGPWHYVGSGIVSLKMPNGEENGLIHENFEFLWIDGKLNVLSVDYSPGRFECLYTLLDPAKPLEWGNGLKLDIPAESFNQMVPVDAGVIFDARAHDGYYYLLYAGRNDVTTYLHRGWNRLALARSKDLVHWAAAGSAD